MALSVESKTKNLQTPKGTKKRHGFFGKIKQMFSPSESSGSSVYRTKTVEDDGESLGTVATRTRSRMSMFGTRENKGPSEAERELEERKSKCLAIKAAKRDPPAVQRLLVDCEFCNPPPPMGRDIFIETPGFTSETAEDNLHELESMMEHNADLSDERNWNVGLDEWIRLREWWLTPTAEKQPIHHLDSDVTPDRYFTVYAKMIHQTRPLRHPLNLSDVIKIVKAGWVGEGSWPDANDNDVWSTSDGEESMGEDETQVNKKKTEPPESTRIGSGQHTATTNAGAGSAAAGHVPHANGNAHEIQADVPRIHVQFSDRPHPRESTPISDSMPRLERVQSSMGAPIHPVRSSQSSIVSITDSE